VEIWRVAVALNVDGDLHAGALARRLGIPRLIIPRAAGVLSAFGLLSAAVVHHLSQTVLCALDGADFEGLNAVLAGFARDARARMDRDGVAAQDVACFYSADLRYRGQSFELNVPLPEDALDRGTARALSQRFHAAHEQRYGYAAPGQPLDLVTLRLRAEGRTPAPQFAKWAPKAKPAGGSLARVCFPGIGWTDCACRAEGALEAGEALDGPALVTRAESTFLLAPGERLRVDPSGHFLVDVPAHGARSGGRVT